MAEKWLQKPEDRMAYPVFAGLSSIVIMGVKSDKGIVIMDEYMSMTEFCKLTGYKQQTVYNKIYRREFQFGKHYIKPTRKKILFKREEIRRWLEGESISTPESPIVRDATQGRINI